MRYIIFSSLSLLLISCSIYFLAKQKKINDKLERLKIEISTYENRIDIQEYFLTSISNTYLNSVLINRNNFTTFLAEFDELNIYTVKKGVIFIFGNDDCDVCINNELMTLDSLSKVMQEKVVVLKHTSKKEELKFLKNNFPSIKEIIPIPEHSYKSFFMEKNTFPFYIVINDSFAGTAFFVPHADFPYLSNRFLEIYLGQE